MGEIGKRPALRGGLQLLVVFLDNPFQDPDLFPGFNIFPGSPGHAGLLIHHLVHLRPDGCKVVLYFFTVDVKVDAPGVTARHGLNFRGKLLGGSGRVKDKWVKVKSIK